MSSARKPTADASLPRDIVYSALIVAAAALGPAGAVGCGDDTGVDTDSAGSSSSTSDSSVGQPTDSTSTAADSSGGSSSTSADSTGSSTSTSGESSNGSTTNETTGGEVQTPFEQAVEAIGGEDALTELERFRVTAEGARMFIYEAPTPDGIVELSTYDDMYTFDLANDGFRATIERTRAYEILALFPPESFDVVLDGDVGGLSAPAGFMAAGPLPSEIVGAFQAQHRLLNPHIVLREGLQDPSLVGDGGMEDVDGVPHRVATIASDIAEIRLLVNEDTGFITRLDTIENNVLVRDVSVQVQYGSWESAGTIAFPSTVTLSVDGEAMLEETRTEVELNPALEEGFFDLPPDTGDSPPDEVALRYGRQSQQVVDSFFNVGFPFPELPVFQSMSLAPNVTLLAGQTNIVAVDYDDGLIVLEAPITPSHGASVLDSLALAFPESPVTHLFQSHFHQDHAGGVRSFVAEGATIVVGSGIASFYEEVFESPSTVRPDLLSETDASPVIEQISDGGTFEVSDADVAVTGYHLASAHSQDMVITTVDVPGARFVYVADLYNAGLGGTLIVGGPEEFFAALRDLGIIEADCSSEVPLTIIPSHGFPLSLADSLAEVSGLGLDVGC